MDAKRYPFLLILLLAVCVAVGWIVSQSDFQAIQESSKAYVQQRHAATSLGQYTGANTFGFWKWGNKDNAIYTSYPYVAYLPAAFLTRVFGSQYYEQISYILGFATVFLIGIAFLVATVPIDYDRTVYRRCLLERLGAGPAIVLVTSPSILGLISEPAWVEAYLLLTIGAIAISKLSQKRFPSDILMTTGFLIYFPAALSVACWSVIQKATALSRFYLLREKLKNPTLRSNIDKTKKSEVRKKGDIFSRYKNLALIGFGAYSALRLLAFASLRNDWQMSGSSLLMRIGLAPKDTTYGGLLGFLRIAFPLPYRNEFNTTTGLATTDLSDLYAKVNTLSLILEHAVLTVVGLTFFLLALHRYSKKLESDRLEGKGFELRFLAFLAVTTIPICLLLPEMIVVHFRDSARFFAPLTAIGVAIAARQICERTMTMQRHHNTAYILALCIVCIDQLRYYFTFYCQ